MDQAPDPSHRGADEALFEIPAHQLEQQAAPFHQIPQKKGSRESSEARSMATIPNLSITCNASMRVDNPLLILLQFEIRQDEVLVRNSPTGPPGSASLPRIQKGVRQERL